MESETNNHEEEREKTLRRRSSILKVPRSRNPYEDEDATDTYSDVSVTKPIRRVSFASSNFVKPFLADPEKNTIWDTTYEENVNHTNSTQSSQEHLTKINSTLFESRANNITKSVEYNMEITNKTLLENKENIAIIPKTTMSLVDYANALAKNTVDTNLASQKFKIFTDDFDPLQSGANSGNKLLTDMSICGKLPSALERTTHVEMSMEYTCQIPENTLGRSKANLESSDNMEFTCQIPVLSKVKDENFMDMSICESSPKDLIIGTIETNAANVEVSVKYSGPIPDHILNENNTIKTDLESSDSMEFTSHIPIKDEIKEEHFEFGQVSSMDRDFSNDKRDVKICGKTFRSLKVATFESTTKNVEINLEATHQTISTLNRNDTVNNKSKSTDNMEFTCQIPVISKIQEEIKVDNFELYQVSTVEKLSSNFTMAMSIDQTSDEVKTDSIKTNTDNVDMSIEYTCQKPEDLSTNSAKISLESPDMEFTCQIPVISTMDNMAMSIDKMTDDVKTGLKKSNPGNVEMKIENTCKTPIDILGRNNANSSKISLESPDNMEFTCQIPVISRIKEEIKEHQVSTVDNMSIDKTTNNITTTSIKTNVENVEMSIEYACQTPGEILSRKNANSSKASLDCDDNMEFTCQFPRLPNQNKKLEFDRVSISPDNMEFTCQIPIKNEIQLNSFTNLMKSDFQKQNASTNLSGPDFKKEILQKSALNKISNSTELYKEASNLMGCSNIINKDCITQPKVLVTALVKPCKNESVNIGDLLSDVNKTFTKKVESSKFSLESEVPREFSNVIEAFSKNCETQPKVLETLVDNSNLNVPSNRFKTEFVKVEETRNESFKGDKTFTREAKPALGCSPKSQIPIRRKSTTVHTPQKFHGKKACDEIKECHDANAEAETNYDSSYAKPEPSFHINFTNISSGIDDTAHLLQCSYSANKQASTTRGLNETENITAPILINCSKLQAENVSLSLSEGVRDMPNSSSFMLPGPSKLSHVNDTYFLKNKDMKNVLEDEEQLTEDASLGLLSDECLQSFRNDGSEVTLDIKEEQNMELESENIYASIPLETKLEPFEYEIASCAHLIPVCENLKTTRSKIKNFFQTFKLKPFDIPEEFDVEEIEEFVSSDEEEPEPGNTLEESIEERQKSCQRCWRLEKSEGDLYYFSSLFGCVIFIVQLQPEGETVVNVETSSKMAVNSKPIARYILNIFLKQMEKVRIEAGIGKQYDLWSLLDYVQMLMLRLHKFQLDFMLDDNVFMDEDFVVKFTLLSYTKPLSLLCEVLVDISNLDNINFERDIQVIERVGNVNQHAIVALASNCSKGLDFVRTFSESLQEYLNQRKQKYFKG